MKQIQIDWRQLIQNQWLPIGLTVIFAVLILWNLSHLFFNKPPADATIQQPIVQQNSKTLEQGLKKNIFGEYIAPDITGAHIKQSMLDLQIVGILYSSIEKNSQVIIQDGGQAKVYTTGDSLSGGAIIKKINRYGVVILYHGNLERLSLPKNELKFSPAPQPLVKE